MGSGRIRRMNADMNQDIPRKLPAAHGFQWVNAGFRLYRKTPLLLSAAFGVLFGAVMALGLIPGVGGALSDLVCRFRNRQNPRRQSIVLFADRTVA